MIDERKGKVLDEQEEDTVTYKRIDSSRRSKGNDQQGMVNLSA